MIRNAELPVPTYLPCARTPVLPCANNKEKPSVLSAILLASPLPPFPFPAANKFKSKKKDSQKIYLSKRQKPVQKPLLRKKKKKSIASPYNVVKPKMQGI